MCHSGPGVGVGSLKSLTRFEEQFRQWLVTHACGVCGVMCGCVCDVCMWCLLFEWQPHSIAGPTRYLGRLCLQSPAHNQASIVQRLPV